MDGDNRQTLMMPNRSAWDERAVIHMHDTTGFYAIGRFCAGEDILLDIVSNEIGDVGNKRIAHLQCHIGLEALCLARRGAVVSGLDFSPQSIAAARTLAAKSGLTATFVCGDVYDAPRLFNEIFDVVFVSWGSLNWLPEIAQWGEVVNALLRPGGYLYLIEQHPFIAAMKEETPGNIVPFFDWRTPPDRPIVTDLPMSYNNDPSRLRHSRLHEWNHPLSDIIGALKNAGLRLEFLHEHEVIPWRRFSTMVPVSDRFYALPAAAARMPLSFSLKASKSNK
jgi:SAM-dependent methyltransferase